MRHRSRQPQSTAEPITNRHRTAQARRDRRGAAMVEFALCFPAIVVMVFGTIEATNVIFTKQRLSAAAYEGSRVAIQRDSTTADTLTRVNEVLTARGVKGTTVVMNPVNVDGLARGTQIKVTVRASCDANPLGPSWFYKGETVQSHVVMIKE